MFWRRTPVLIEAVSRGDASALADLHKTCFDHNWDAAAFHRLLRNPAAHGLVARAHDRPELCGLIMLNLAADESEVLTIGVAPSQRRNKIGRRLMDTAVSEMQMRGARRMFLEVASSNLAARKLYESLGFIEVGRRKGYYVTSDIVPDDALIMQRMI